MRQAIVDVIDAETKRAQEKHHFSLENRAVNDPTFASTVLSEEVGEVAERALQLDESFHLSGERMETRAKLREELIHVASVAIRWLDVLNV